MKRRSISLEQQIGQSSGNSGCPPFEHKQRRNMKKLSLSIHSLPTDGPGPEPEPSRRPSIVSLPATTSLLHRRDEDGDSPSLPYTHGPVQVIPGIWIGSEDNARDWPALQARGIKAILNVAKEVFSPFDAPRPHSSTPNFQHCRHADPTYYPPHLPTSRPAMHYLKLPWSHGEQDLVQNGFMAGFVFADAALRRGEGCLIHCQCGVSRSATMVIALVMRAAAERLSSVPPEVWALKGMHAAYAFVKEKSPAVGPNMSLIYQLMEYEKKLKGETGSTQDEDSSSATDDEEEWGRQRKALEDASDNDLDVQESSLIMQEARALDKAMEDRIVARKSSASSISSIGSGLGMGPAWRSRYGHRKRTGSVASSNTNGSFLSEDLVEEDEEQELLGVRRDDFDDDIRPNNLELSPATTPDEELVPPPHGPSSVTPLALRPPPSAPAWKTSFTSSPPPLTAIRSTFELPLCPPKPKRRPVSLSILPPVPPSPVNLVIESDQAALAPLPLPPVRQRAESRRLIPPPLHLRNSVLRKTSGGAPEITSSLNTPSQTLFVFPPSPTLNARTPSTMTLTSTPHGPIPFPSLSTPRISTFRSKGRTRSFIGLGATPAPTVAFSKVDVRGYVGLE